LSLQAQAGQTSSVDALGFAISTELFIAYDRGVNESAYWTLATAILATLITLEIWGRSQPRAGRHAHGPAGQGST
jgi:hypothetical protein